MLAFMGPYFSADEVAAWPASRRARITLPRRPLLGVVSVPHPRALSAQFDSGSKHALCSRPRSVSGGLRPSWTIGELRPLHWVVREERLQCLRTVGRNPTW